MTRATPPRQNRHDTLGDVTGRSGRGTARQTIRVPEDLWERFGELAGDQRRSELVREFIRWYVGEDDAQMPERPEGETDG